MRLLTRRKIHFYLLLAGLVLTSTTKLFAQDSPIRVAVFKGAGVGPSANDLMAALKSTGGQKLEVIRITVEEIRAGKLAGVHVLVHPGGSGGGQGRALGEDGRKAVQDFVSRGGGYLGVCAGAYLATNDYPWSLNLIDAKVVDKQHWARGTGKVKIQLSEKGSELLQEKGRELDIHYAQGPLLARREVDDPKVPNYESLATFSSEIAKKGAPSGVMQGTSAIVRSEYGTGRVLCFSPHPEMTVGLHHLIPLAISWLVPKKP
ncbi:BPL-N domain-containing protein [Armatimonas sp.]|uniref:BPL-N domain-containing protein n=1 Tax=Armatimonas sp. TaxID=1872638 RepID=UPI00286B2B48|nr:BPL-N domain-containing protein [Armatimonas sp.]